MKEIEIGDYVRTKNGIIDKVESYSINCCVWHCKNGMCIDKCNCIGTHLEDIANHSKQLIDLIEIGDFVNGYIVTDKYLFAGKRLVLETEGDDTNCQCLCEEDIKTILTKEQYMANCYKVGGEDE